MLPWPTHSCARSSSSPGSTTSRTPSSRFARATRRGASCATSARCPSSRRSLTAGRPSACSRSTCRTSRSPSASRPARPRSPGRAVAAERDGRLPHRARPDAREAEASLGGAKRLHPRRLERPPHARRPLERTHGRAALRLCADAGLSFEATDRALPRAVRECAGRPPARARRRRPRIRSGRRRRPRDHRREPRHRGGCGRRHARRARLRALHAAGGGAGGCPADGAARPRPIARRHGISRLHPHLPGRLGIDAELVPVSGSVEAARGSDSPTRSSTSSRRARPRAPTGCGCSVPCSSPRPSSSATTRRSSGARSSFGGSS